MNLNLMKNEEIIDLLNKLEDKYKSSGQNIVSYLKGLYKSRYITYWNYIDLDTLLTLQNPITDLKDEEIFITIHQITELYFKLILKQCQQIANNKNINVKELIHRVDCINCFIEGVIKAWTIMADTMDIEQYSEFRAALSPASGLQSCQYRMIEICLTDMLQLVEPKLRNHVNRNNSIEEIYNNLYWNKASINYNTGHKSLTLQQFEEKYAHSLIDFAKEFQTKNLWAKYKSLPEDEQKNEALISSLRNLDKLFNIVLPLIHYQLAKQYLGDVSSEGTGGSDWKKYLHPKYQRKIFYPQLWSEDEIANWGVKGSSPKNSPL